MPKTPKPRTRHAQSRPHAAAGGVHAGKRHENGHKAPRKTAAEGPSDSLHRGRQPYAVAPEGVVLRTDPAILPESPRASHGLFELVPAVARRALELGLSAREP